MLSALFNQSVWLWDTEDTEERCWRQKPQEKFATMTEIINRDRQTHRPDDIRITVLINNSSLRLQIDDEATQLSTLTLYHVLRTTEEPENRCLLTFLIRFLHMDCNFRPCPEEIRSSCCPFHSVKCDRFFNSPCFFNLYICFFINELLCPVLQKRETMFSGPSSDIDKTVQTLSFSVFSTDDSSGKWKYLC